MLHYLRDDFAPGESATERPARAIRPHQSEFLGMGPRPDVPGGRARTFPAAAPGGGARPSYREISGEGEDPVSSRPEPLAREPIPPPDEGTVRDDLRCAPGAGEGEPAIDPRRIDAPTADQIAAAIADCDASISEALGAVESDESRLKAANDGGRARTLPADMGHAISYRFAVAEKARLQAGDLSNLVERLRSEARSRPQPPPPAPPPPPPRPHFSGLVDPSAGPPDCRTFAAAVKLVAGVEDDKFDGLLLNCARRVDPTKLAWVLSEVDKPGVGNPSRLVFRKLADACKDTYKQSRSKLSR